MMLVEPNRMTETRLAVPSISEGGWLEVEATGLSGIEVQAWEGEHRMLRYPLIPGHQVVGRISDLAGAHWELSVGTRVVVESGLRCGACRRCTGRLHSCSARRPLNAYGVLPSTEPPGLWGGLAELLYLDPGARLHVVGEDIPAAMATFAHPLAAGFTWAVEQAELQAGESVLILGPGPRGLAALLAAKEAGAGWVGVSGLSHDADRLGLAKDLGADLVVDAQVEEVASAVADSLGARPDVVLDATSDDPEAFHISLDLVRPGGRVVLASTKGTNAVHALLSDVIVLKELVVRGAFGASSAGYHWAVRQLEQDPRIDRLVSHEFPLEEAERAILATAGRLGREELISVAVTIS